MIDFRLLELLKDAKKYVYYQVISKWIILFLRILITYLISHLVNSYIQGTLTEQLITYSIIITLIFFYIIYIFEKINVQSTTKASLNVKKILRKKIYNKLIKLGISYNENFATSNLVQLSVEGVEQLEVCFGLYISQVFYCLIATMTSFIAIYRICPKAAWVLLICVPLIPISIMIVQIIAATILGKYWKSYTDLGEAFLENLQGLTTLKIYQYDKQKSLEMEIQAEKFRKETMKVLVMQLNSIGLIDFMTYGGASLGMSMALSEYKINNINFGQAIVIILLSFEFFLPLSRLTSLFHVAMNGMTASKKIFKFLDLKEEKDKTLELNKENPIDIKIKNVNFSYKDDNYILKNINFEINTNDFIAFVGESGCGKTTLSKIFSGNLTKYNGNIIIQGKELKNIKEDSISENIVLISSDSYIFKGTIKDNLLMAKYNATDEEMINVLKKVKLNEILEKKGLDTILNEEGNNLSGGQKQKLALARALLFDAPFYIFDEATSNIDKESESDIMKVIKSLKGNKTIIFISHRLRNVVDCDKIYLLQKGEIKECGTHQELLDKKELYYELFHTQKELENYSLTHKKNKKEIIIDNMAKVKDEELNLSDEENNLNNDSKNIFSKEYSNEVDNNKLETTKTLLILVKPLILVMILAITFGLFGFISSTFLPIKSMQYIFIFSDKNNNNYNKSYKSLLFFISISKGFLKYIEQYCNHYIAFKLLALIRNQIFEKLRILCPAKLENKSKGNLISLITSDIELIEVFYAHTISPVFIAIFFCSFMIIYITHISYIGGIITITSYFFIGIIIPLIITPKLEKIALNYRNKTGEMNSFMLISLRGIRETLQYLGGNNRLNQIEQKCNDLAELKMELSKVEEIQKASTNMAVIGASYSLFFILLIKLYKGQITLFETIMPMIALINSFGPVIALSNLSLDLSQTFACVKRVKNLLNEEPVINEVHSGKKISDDNININNINFSYKNNKNEVFNNFSCIFEKGKIIGIHGKSGCGKSTLLKLIMRFWDVDNGEIKFGNDNIKSIDVNELRKFESYLTQDTYLFNDTIEANIRLAKENATKEEIIEACKKASIHNFIMTLPKKYDTKVGELGSMLSSGEKQRIGVARAFIHYPKLLLLDEPTSNLDSLNEGIILKSIMEEENKKTVIIVSHRESTLDCVDEIIKFK